MTRRKFGHLAASLASIITLMITMVSAAPPYLREETLALPMDGRTIHSQLPLDPSRQYEIEIRSAHTLRPVLWRKEVCETKQGFFEKYQECHKELAAKLAINSIGTPTATSYTSVPTAEGMYFDKPDTSQHYIPSLLFYVWGTGKPFTINTTEDVASEILTAQVIITDLAVRREAQAVQAQQARADEARREDERQAQARVEELRLLEAVKEARQAREKEEKEARGVLIVKVGIGILIGIGGIILYRWVYSRYRQAVEAAQRIREQARLDQEEVHRHIHEQAKIHEAEAQERAAQQQRAAEQERLEREAARRQAERQAHIWKLEQLQRIQSYLKDPAEIEKYAVKNLDTLLTNQDAILEKYFHFCKEIEPILKAQGREDLIEFALWHVKAFGAAFQQSYTVPERKQLTPRQFRERMVERERVHIDDETAKAFVAFESIESILDAREAKIQAIETRADLNNEQKQDRIHIIRTVADVRLAEFQKGSTNDTPRETPPPVILGQS